MLKSYVHGLAFWKCHCIHKMFKILSFNFVGMPTEKYDCQLLLTITSSYMTRSPRRPSMFLRKKLILGHQILFFNIPKVFQKTPGLCLETQPIYKLPFFIKQNWTTVSNYYRFWNNFRLHFCLNISATKFKNIVPVCLGLSPNFIWFFNRHKSLNPGHNCILCLPQLCLETRDLLRTGVL